MAVQAQYPSNVLLLNRNGQEGHDYSLQLQPQPGGGFLDQSYMLFNNGGNNNNNNNNTRKRGREVAAPNTTTSSAAAMTNLYSTMQSQQAPPPPPQLISLSQLHNHHQPNVVSTGLRLSFGDHQQHQQQLQQTYHHHQQHQQQQNVMCQSSPSFFSFISEDLATPIKRHHDELDQFLQAQGEQLRRALAEKRQRHYRALLGAAEESIARRLRDKEAEVEKATRRNAELEARAAQLSVESQVWQAKARAQEATAASLQAQLQQAIMSGAGGGGVGGLAGAHDSRRGDEGLMCCTGEVAEDAESAYVDPDRVVPVNVNGPTCKGCGKRDASVVLLPCRHLCVCTECDRVVQSCPLCFNGRDSSVEVFLS